MSVGSGFHEPGSLTRFAHQVCPAVPNPRPESRNPSDNIYFDTGYGTFGLSKCDGVLKSPITNVGYPRIIGKNCNFSCKGRNRVLVSKSTRASMDAPSRNASGP